MNCQHALNKMDDFLETTLTGQEAMELQRHLDHCQQCRALFRKEQELLAALRSLPVPPPSADFIKRSLVAARDSQQRSWAKEMLPYWGGAVAACLALWLMVGSPFSPALAPLEQPAQQTMTIHLNEQRLVQVVVDAPRDMLAADVVIELPAQLEMAGFPGLREIRWNTNLRKGKNLLSLPLIAKSEGRAELITHINHENRSKMLSLVMTVRHDDLTQTGHATLCTV